MPTRSPGRAPSDRSAWARRFTRASAWRKVTTVSPWLQAGRCGWRRATRVRKWAACTAASARRELRHHTAGEELERPERLPIAHPSEVDLHRGLDLAEDLDLEPELLHHFVRRSDQRLVALEHRLDCRPRDRLHDLAVAGVLARFTAGPRAHGLAEDVDVALDARPGALDGLPVRLRHVAVQRGLDLLPPRRVTGVAPRLAIDAHHLAHPVDPSGVGHDHHVVAAPARPDERLPGGDRGDPDGRVGALHGTRHQMDVLERVELALVGDAVLGPEPGDDLDAFLVAGAALLHAHAEHLELLRDERATEARVEAALAQVVQHGELRRQLDGVVEGRDDRARDGADASGAGRDGRQE